MPEVSDPDPCATRTLHPPSCSLQVDFSQSVYHLWKQFRRFGKAGSKDVMGLDKAGEAGPGPDSRLQIKVTNWPLLRC